MLPLTNNLSNPRNGKHRAKPALPALPRIEGSESNSLDISLLDLMAVDDFLNLLKNKTDTNAKELWRELYSITTHLKASRELLSIGSNLFSHRATAQILERLVEASYVVLNAERVMLMEIDPVTGKDLIITHSKEKRVIGQRIPVNAGVEGDVIVRKICANVPDVSKDSRYVPGANGSPLHHVKTLICAPIIADGIVLGVMEAINKKQPIITPRSSRELNSISFSANDALLLSFIAANAGLALSSLTSSANAPHHQILPAHVNVEMYHSPEPTLESIMNTAAVKNLWKASYDRLQAERVSVFVYNPQTQMLVCSLSQDIEGLSVPCDKGFAGLCFNSRRIVNITDAPDDNRHNSEIDHQVGFHTKKLLCSPMLISDEGNAIGVVQAVNKKDGSSFNTQDEDAIIEISKSFVQIFIDEGLELEKHMEGGISSTAACESAAVEAIPVSGKQGSLLSSIQPELDFEVTFSRCIGSMMLVNNITEAVRELNIAVRTLTTCDFIGAYVLSHGKINRIKSSIEITDTAGDDDDANDAAANAALTLAGVKPPNASIQPNVSAKNEHCMEVLNISDMPIQMKQALQFSTIAEFSLPEGKAGQPQYLLPDIPVQQALIVPITSKVMDCSEPGSCVLVIGKTSRLGATVSSMRSIIEAICENFNCAVLNLSNQIVQQESAHKLKSQFHLLNNTLAALRDYVVLLNSEGRFMASNKSVEELLGGPNCKRPGSSSAPGTPSHIARTQPTAPLAAISEGSHYTEWLTQGNSPELMRDISSVLSTGTARCMDKVKLFTAVHPEGVIVDYQVIPIENPECLSSCGLGDMKDTTTVSAPPKLSRSTRADSMDKLPVPIEGKEGLSNFVVLLVIHTENFHHQRTLGHSASPHMKLASLANLSRDMLDTETAHGVVDAATTIVNSVRNSYSLNADLEETLKSITHSLNNASRKLSIMETSRTSMSHALLSKTIALVNNAEILPPDLFEWEFNVLKITDGLHLCNIIGKLFESLCNLAEMDIDKAILARYIAEVGKNYHDRHFHNLQHATCVTHFTYKLITATNAAANLNNYQIFAIMISAVVHDVDHPGNTNLFEVNSASELALRYNDQAVLENHHCSTAFRLMRKANTQVLGTLSKRTVAEIRKTIISSVMATDMAVHFDLIDETKRKAEQGWKFEEEKDRFFLGKILLHAADLSNPVRPFHMTKEWARRISMEFNDQVTREKALGMPVLGFMETPDEKAFCKNEIGFASFVVAPMWRALSMVYPSLDFLVKQLEENVDVWKETLATLEAPHGDSSSEEKKTLKQS